MNIPDGIDIDHLPRHPEMVVIDVMGTDTQLKCEECGREIIKNNLGRTIKVLEEGNIWALHHFLGPLRPGKDKTLPDVSVTID